MFPYKMVYQNLKGWLHSSVNYRKLLQFTFLSCFNLPLLFRGGNSALSSIVGQSASVNSDELSPIIQIYKKVF